MSIVCCLIHEMRDSTRLWYSSHLESTSCGVRESLQALLLGQGTLRCHGVDPVPCCDATPGTVRRRILLGSCSLEIQIFPCRAWAVLWPYRGRHLLPLSPFHREQTLSQSPGGCPSLPAVLTMALIPSPPSGTLGKAS